MTKLCDFCSEYAKDGTCRLGRPTPRALACQDFAPEMPNFFANPADFTGAAQVVQMATYFGLRGREMKKVKLMAARAEERRDEDALEAAAGRFLVTEGVGHE